MLTSLRNYPSLATEQRISTRDLIRRINKANGQVTADLFRLTEVSNPFITTWTLSSSANPTTLPDRVVGLIQVTRAGKQATIYKPNMETLVANSNVNYTHTTDYPAVIDWDNFINVYPTPSSSAIVLTYYQKPAYMEWGKGVASTITTNHYITLEPFAKLSDDYYNGEYIQVYVDSTTGIFPYGRFQITDYLAASNLCTIVNFEGRTLTDGISYFYAFEPLLPHKYHDKIVLLTELDLINDGLLLGNIKLVREEYLTFLKLELGNGKQS